MLDRDNIAFLILPCCGEDAAGGVHYIRGTQVPVNLLAESVFGKMAYDDYYRIGDKRHAAE
jgi:hypothetical protein